MIFWFCAFFFLSAKIVYLDWRLLCINSGKTNVKYTNNFHTFNTYFAMENYANVLFNIIHTLLKNSNTGFTHCLPMIHFTWKAILESNQILYRLQPGLCMWLSFCWALFFSIKFLSLQATNSTTVTVSWSLVFFLLLFYSHLKHSLVNDTKFSLYF